MTPFIEQKCEAWANKFGLPIHIIKAIVEVESGGNPWAIRHEPAWKLYLKPSFWAKRIRITDPTERISQSMSWGLMQIMGTVARELNFDRILSELCDPDVGLEYGCLKFKQCLYRYNSIPDALAAYNAGNPKRAAGKQYAAKVLRTSLLFSS